MATLIWNVFVSPLAHSGEQYQESSAYKYFAVSIENLTELRRMEHVRRDFIANISHELRTPLASVRLLVETLEDAIDTDREKAQVFVEKIETEVQYLTDLVTDLLELCNLHFPCRSPGVDQDQSPVPRKLSHRHVAKKEPTSSSETTCLFLPSATAYPSRIFNFLRPHCAY